MKKIFSVLAACLLTIAASAQTMNVHLKDGSTVSYTSTDVDYVDFTAADPTALGAEWKLIASDVQFTEYYNSLPGFTADLYCNADSTEYCFRNFATGYNLYFTVTSVEGTYSYLGNYIYPVGGSTYGDYSYFGPDTWNSSFPLYWQNWEGHYADGSAVYTNTTYTTINFDDKYGWLCLYIQSYTDAGEYEKEIWAYLQFSWK
jgi:hypothetical protein